MVWVVDILFGKVREGTIIKSREEDGITVYTIETDEFRTINTVEGMFFNNRGDAVANLQKKLKAKIREAEKMLKDIK